MKRYLAIIFLMFVGISVVNAQQYVYFENKIGATGGITITNSQAIIGSIDQVLIQAPSRTSTGVVSIVVTPAVGSNMTRTVIYTNATVTAAASAMPRVIPTDNTGTALVALTVAEKYFCKGDTVTVYTSEANSITNVTFKVWLKVE